MEPNISEQIDASPLIERLTQEIAALHMRLALAETRLDAERAKNATNGGADA